MEMSSLQKEETDTEMRKAYEELGKTGIKAARRKSRDLSSMWCKTK